MDKLDELAKFLIGRSGCGSCGDSVPDLPAAKVQLSIIQRKIAETQVGCPFAPGDVITTRKDSDVYRYPKHGDVAVVVETDILRQLPHDGNRIARRDMIISTLYGNKVVEHFVDSREFEKLEVPE